MKLPVCVQGLRALHSGLGARSRSVHCVPVLVSEVKYDLVEAIIDSFSYP